MHYLIFAMLFSVLALLGASPPSVARAEGCRYLLGFAALHDMIPQQVGQCLENEHHNPENGDGLQATMNGLLVWRKSDNWTAFTNGSQTWVNGPFGLQERSNLQRFAWEQNPERLAIVPPLVPGERCHSAALGLTLDGVDVGAGNLVGTFRFTNNTDIPCSLYGYPGVQLLDGRNNPLPTNVVRGGGWMSTQPGPTLIAVPGRGSAIFRMHWEQIEVGNETTCPVSSFLAVTPPDEYDSLNIPAQIRACGGGRLDMSAVQLGG